MWLPISAAPGWVQRLGPRLRKAAVRGLQSAGHRLVQEILRVVDETDPKPFDRGLYQAGWRSTPTREGAIVHNDVPWAPIVEWGARAKNIKPSRAMVDALAEWVMRKGLVAKREGGASAGSANSEARAMAWAIVTSMMKRGIFNRDGQPGLRILERARRRLPQIVAEEVKREVEKEKGRSE
jgi:hypothetical protein